MNWIQFFVIAVVLVVVAGLVGGWLLPMVGIDSGLARALCFAVAGGIIAVLLGRRKGVPGA